jgi:predicted transcriptional regulator
MKYNNMNDAEDDLLDLIEKEPIKLKDIFTKFPFSESAIKKRLRQLKKEGLIFAEYYNIAGRNIAVYHRRNLV